MPSALLTADSAKLSIVAIKPDKLRVSYRDGTVDRSTMVIRAALPTHAAVLSIRAGGSGCAVTHGHFPCPLRGCAVGMKRPAG
jgi:hypothetical protein